MTPFQRTPEAQPSAVFDAVGIRSWVSDNLGSLRGRSEVFLLIVSRHGWLSKDDFPPFLVWLFHDFHDWTLEGMNRRFSLTFSQAPFWFGCFHDFHGHEIHETLEGMKWIHSRLRTRLDQLRRISHHPVSFWVFCWMWGFPKIGVSQNGWFIMENPIKMDDLGVPLFSETPMCKRIRNWEPHLGFPYHSRAPDGFPLQVVGCHYMEVAVAQFAGYYCYNTGAVVLQFLSTIAISLSCFWLICMYTTFIPSQRRDNNVRQIIDHQICLIQIPKSAELLKWANR